MNYFDRNDKKVKIGDVIDLHQTVNGSSLFWIVSLEPLDIRYYLDHNRKYEYDKHDLLSPSQLTFETEFEVINNFSVSFLWNA
jgi:hypothetical protein